MSVFDGSRSVLLTLMQMPRCGRRPPKRARQSHDMVRITTFLRPAATLSLHAKMPTPSSFPQTPDNAITRTSSHQDCMYANVRRSKTTSTSTWMPRLQLHTSWFPAHESTCTPHAMQSRSQLREDEKRQRLAKGLLRGACRLDDGWYCRCHRCSHFAQRIGRLQTCWIRFLTASTLEHKSLRSVSISPIVGGAHHVCES
jgi:hypothetical protein